MKNKFDDEINRDIGRCAADVCTFSLSVQKQVLRKLMYDELLAYLVADINIGSPFSRVSDSVLTLCNHAYGILLRQKGLKLTKMIGNIDILNCE